MTLGEICNRRRVVVLSDEIHCDFVTKGHTYTPFATLDDEAVVRNSITYKSVSKSFNLSMMKCSYLFSTNPDYLERIEGVGQHRQAMNTLGIIAAEAAYDECEDWLDQLLEYIDGTQDLVEAYVRSNVPGREDRQAGGHLSGMARRRQAAMEATGMQQAAKGRCGPGDMTPEQAFQRYLVDHAHIHLNPGSSYGLGGAGRMRMNIATSRQLVERALEQHGGGASPPSDNRPSEVGSWPGVCAAGSAPARADVDSESVVQDARARMRR